MSRSAFLGLTCVVIAAHVAIFATAVERSTTRNGEAVEVASLQIISLIKPVDSNTKISTIKRFHEIGFLQPKGLLVEPRVLQDQVPNRSLRNTRETLPPLAQVEAPLNTKAMPDLMVETTEGQVALAEVLRARLPYITGLVTLEFLIGSDGFTKHINCFEDSCTDMVLASLPALLDLKFQLTLEMQELVEFKKVIEIEPAHRF